MNWFLVFPKLTLGGQSGILIGEILLILFLLKSVILNQYKFKLGLELKLILVLAFYYFVVSNFFFYMDGLSLAGAIYFCKLLLLFLAYSFISRSSGSTKEDLFHYLIKPYFLMSLISFVIFIIYKIIFNPSIGEVLWGYSLGARLIPSFGLGLDLVNKGLSPVGGGSGNLLGSFSLIVLIVICNTELIRYKRLLIAAIFLFVFLALSRGSLITLVLYLSYFFLFKKKKIIQLCLISIITMILLVIWGDEINLVKRLADTVSNKGLDPSSMGRVINYIDGYSAWVSSFRTIFLGIGSDESQLETLVGAPLIESFYLGLLYSGGVVSIVIFMFFMTVVIYRRNVNLYYRYLFEYLVFQSIIQWTLAGGDFWGPVNMYIMVVLLALANQKHDNLKLK